LVLGTKVFGFRVHMICVYVWLCSAYQEGKILFSISCAACINFKHNQDEKGGVYKL